MKNNPQIKRLFKPNQNYIWAKYFPARNSLCIIKCKKKFAIRENGNNTDNLLVHRL